MPGVAPFILHHATTIAIGRVSWLFERTSAGPEGPPALVRHAGCGAPIRVSLTCDQGHELGERPRVWLEPGPGSRTRPEEPQKVTRR